MWITQNLLDHETLDLLVAVAEESGLNQAIKAYFEGKDKRDRAGPSSIPH